VALSLPLGAGTGKAAAKLPTDYSSDIPVHCEAGAVAVKRSGGADGAGGTPQ
jgi:hypothetical protein